MRLALLIIATVLLAACGDDGPSTPTSPTPSTAQVGGVWSFTSTVQSVSGSDCLVDVLRRAVGLSATATVSVTQTGSNLTATVAYPNSAYSCRYDGSVGSSSFSLTLRSCDFAYYGVRCSNGALRDYEPSTENIQGTVSGASMSGTSVSAANVYSGTNGAYLGQITQTESFTGFRR